MSIEISRIARLRGTPSQRPLIIGIISILLLGVFSVVSHPKVVFQPSSRALISVHVSGWGAHVTKSSIVGRHPMPLTLKQGGGLWPTSQLKSQQPVAVSVSYQTWPILAWLPGFHGVKTIRLVTPASPRLVSHRTVLKANRQASLQFNETVHAVSVVLSKTKKKRVSLRAPSQALLIPFTPHVNQSGHFVVAAQARSWESFASPQTFSWQTLPWLTASPSSSKITPAADGSVKVTVHFSRAVSTPHWSTWRFSPKLKGTWSRINSHTFLFTSSRSMALMASLYPLSTLTLQIPGGSQGPQNPLGSTLKSPAHLSWTLAPGSILRLQELLAQLHYLPVTWTPTSSTTSSPNLSFSQQYQTIWDAPRGNFGWRFSKTPSALKSLFSPHLMTPMIAGAIMSFERVHNMTVDGIPGPHVWKSLIRAVARNEVDPHRYSYVYVTEKLPETLTLWANGHVMLTTLVNTGIPQTPTYIGTHPVYLRYRTQTMRGVNPNGVPYKDAGIPYVNYFYKGDAVHGFVRAQYGFPQSLGCVELPISNAAKAWNAIHYGTLVTVHK